MNQAVTKFLVCQKRMFTNLRIKLVSFACHQQKNLVFFKMEKAGYVIGIYEICFGMFSSPNIEVFCDDTIFYIFCYDI